jgi:ELWxxDGT repeat protein
MAIRIVFPSASQLSGFLVDAELSFSDGSAITGTADIFTGLDGMSVPNSSHPVNFMKIGNKLVFEATDNTHGRELWVTDGTAAGTHFLVDINTVSPTDTHDSTDRASSWQFSQQSVFDFQAPAIFNGFAYFKADDGVTGLELWKTNGTAAGTTLVANINPGANGSSPGLLTPSGGLLYFIATTTANGVELWKTDGTNTDIVADLVTGNGNSNPDNLTDFNGTLYFTAADESFGPLHLWKTTGGAPTQISGADFASQLTPLGNLLLFNKADNDHGAELWKYDGTTAQMVKNIGTLPTGSNPLPDFGSNPQNLTVFNGFVYFWAQDDTHGYEVWRSDGSEIGTTLFADINTTSPNESSGPGSPFVISGNKLYFLANDGHTGQELWVTDGVDGTAAHTHIVKDIVGGANISSFAGNAFPHMTDVDGTLYFTINDNTANGLYSLYKTDGTTANTVPVAEHVYFSGNSVNPFDFLSTGVVVDLNGEEAEGIDFTAVGFIENGPAVAIADATATLTGSGDITGATITITNVKANDVLSIAGALPAGISNGGFNAATGVLTLSGTASLAAYETAIKQIRFSNTSENPDATARTITVVTTDTDGATNDPPPVASVGVTAVNDAPVNSVPGAQAAIQNINKAIAGLAVSDVDAGSLTTTLSVLHGTLTVSSIDATGVFGSGTASVTLTGTLAQINATLSANNNVTYKSDPSFFGSDTLTVLSNDAGNTGSGGAQSDSDAVTILVLAPPAITSNGGGDTATVNVLERTAAVTTVVATDPDSPSLTFSIVGGDDSGKFQINASTGALSFITAPDFDVRNDADHNNSYVVQVRVSDGVLTDDQTLSVQVTDNPNVKSTLHWVKSVDSGAHPAGWVPAGRGDFNADGMTDLAWFNAATGNLDIWKLTDGGWAGSSNAGSHPLGYQPIGLGDFNNDGTDDVIWYNPITRDVDLWKISNGQWAGSVNVGTHPAGFTPTLIGDFNGDGAGADILWHNPTTNAVDIWKIDGLGQWAGSVNLGTHPAGFTPALAGDFNGDGTSDVLWYNPTTGQADIWKIDNNGQWAGSVAAGTHPLGWQPLGAADFNRDGTSDVAWYNRATNNVDVWLINNGQLLESANVGSHPGAGPDSPVARGGIAQPVVAIGVGDFDHNGVNDIMWHNTGNGHIENWMLDYS